MVCVCCIVLCSLLCRWWWVRDGDWDALPYVRRMANTVLHRLLNPHGWDSCLLVIMTLHTHITCFSSFFFSSLLVLLYTFIIRISISSSLSFTSSFNLLQLLFYSYYFEYSSRSLSLPSLFCFVLLFSSISWQLDATISSSIFFFLSSF